MSEHPLFTQKHYEHMISEIRKRRGYIPRRFVDVLCEIFHADNPKFKANLFRESCQEEGEENEWRLF